MKAVSGAPFVHHQGLNEFVDLNEEEKRFLDLWKRFIRSDTVVPDDIIPEKCLIFIRDHVRAMQGLRQQLLMHMMTLWEHRLVSSSHILTCMKEYDSLHSTSEQKAKSTGLQS
jgi:hypothetical protein